MERNIQKITGKFSVAILDNKAYIKVQGYASFKNCIFLENFIKQMLERKINHFVLDFSLCEGMDSTFMGVLVATKVSLERNQRNSCSVTLINTNTYHKNLLDSLGVSCVVTIAPMPMPVSPIPLQQLQETCETERETLDMIHKAHAHLVNLNSKNKTLFQDFLEMIEQEREDAISR